MKMTSLIFLTLVLSACATLDVTESQRTTSGEYNGTWTGKFNKTDPVQFSNTTRNRTVNTFSCRDINGEITAEVSDGVISGIIGLKKPVEFSTKISSNGRLYFEIPRESIYFAASDNYYYEVQIQGDAKVRTHGIGTREYHVLEGSLNSTGANSELVYTSALGMRGGCKYSVDLMRISEALSDATQLK